MQPLEKALPDFDEYFFEKDGTFWDTFTVYLETYEK